MKSANIKLIEARNQPRKRAAVLTGEVSRRTAIAAESRRSRDGMLIAEVVIPYAHEALLKTLTLEAWKLWAADRNLVRKRSLEAKLRYPSRMKPARIN